jgi:MFS family permease
MNRRIKRSLKIISTESVITSAIMSIVVIVPFMQSIGMSMVQVGLSQAVFTAVLLAFNVPCGWLADKFSRRTANIVGDFGKAICFLLYSQANSFTEVVVWECLLGIFSAFTDGVDGGLIKSYADTLDSSGKLYGKRMASIAIAQHLFMLVMMLLGGVVGAWSMRMTLLLDSVPYFIGGGLAFWLVDVGEKTEHSMPTSVGAILRDAGLRWRIMAYVVCSQVTHAMVWAMTPLLLLAGVPLWLVGSAWALNSVAAVIGACIGKLCVAKEEATNELLVFIIPMAVSLGGMFVMSVHFSLITMCFYACLGLTRGWVSAVVKPMVYNHAPEELQTSAMSLASTFGHILYIPTVALVGWVSDIDIRLSMVATLVIFVPLAILVAFKLKKHPKK